MQYEQNQVLVSERNEAIKIAEGAKTQKKCEDESKDLLAHRCEMPTCECDQLNRRIAELESELDLMKAHAESIEYGPMIEAIRLGGALRDAALKKERQTTSLAKDVAGKEYKALVEKLKGRRVVFCGKVVDVGKRILSLSQFYLTLRVAVGYDVKIIFEKDSEDELVPLKVGDEVVFGAYVVSTGDLNHDLTVAGPVKVRDDKYERAVVLSRDLLLPQKIKVWANKEQRLEQLCKVAKVVKNPKPPPVAGTGVRLDPNWKKLLADGYEPSNKTRVATNEMQRGVSLIKMALDARWNQLALKVGKPGVVVLKVDITTDGQLVNCRIIKSCGDLVSDNAVLAVATTTGRIAGLSPEFIRQNSTLTINYKVDDS